jgi:hypothetical protein
VPAAAVLLVVHALLVGWLVLRRSTLARVYGALTRAVGGREPGDDELRVVRAVLAALAVAIVAVDVVLVVLA